LIAKADARQRASEAAECERARSRKRLKNVIGLVSSKMLKNARGLVSSKRLKTARGLASRERLKDVRELAYRKRLKNIRVVSMLAAAASRCVHCLIAGILKVDWSHR
jgi:hypothetical protein